MIIDQFGVFFDAVAATASMTGKVVNCNNYAGREDPVYITVVARGANTAAVTYTVNVQHSENGSAFTTVGTYTIAKPNAAPAIKAIRLPADVRFRNVRLTVTATGTLTGQTLFAAVTQDHFAPYAEGQFINAGKVVA